MKMSCGLISPLGVSLLVFALSSQAGVAMAAEQARGMQDPLEKVVALNEQALNQLQAGKYEAARDALWGAIAILNDANMGGHEIAARIHVYLAAVYMTGFNDTNKAIRQLVVALKIDPNVTVTPRVETVALDDAFDAARSQAGLTPKEKETAAVPAPTAEVPVEPVAEKGATPASEISDPWKDTSGGGSAAPSVAPRARKANARPYERAGLDEPSDADTSEHGHVGFALNMGIGNGKLGYGLGVGVGYRPGPLVEIGLLVGAWLDGSTVIAIPILFQFNGILPVNPILGFFVGGQLGLLHHRLETSTHGVVGLNAFAAGPQAGAAVRLTSWLSLRFELSFLRTTDATTTFTSYNSTTTYGVEGTNIFNATGAFCVTF